MLRHCQGILRDGRVQALTKAEGDAVIAANNELASQGFRVRALAARRGDQAFLTLPTQDLEQELIFIGLVPMFDPPRPGITEAIAQCHSAGIKVTMVTGDYGLTAEAIALVYGTVMRNLSIALAIAITAFGGEQGSEIALIIAMAYIIQVQAAAWYVKLTGRIFGLAEQALPQTS